MEKLIGKTITEVKIGSDSIVFYCSDQSKFKQHHRQDENETVFIESVTGDLDNLIGFPILDISDDVGEEVNYPNTEPMGCETFLSLSFWNKYYLSTVKGTVVISWYGIRGDCCSGDYWKEIILRETGYYIIKDGMKMGINPNFD